MAKRKKNKVRNNFRQIKGTWYYRLMVWNGRRQHEWTIPMKTKEKDVANRQYMDHIKPIISDIRGGHIQKFQLEELLPWLNNTKTVALVELSLEHIIPDYLAYKESKLRAQSVRRDKVSLNQFCDFVGYTKPIAELNYLDIEGHDGLINYLQKRGYENNGINITLRHLRTFFNWLHKKARLIDEPIHFDMLPTSNQEYFCKVLKSTNSIVM